MISLAVVAIIIVILFLLIIILFLSDRENVGTVFMLLLLFIFFSSLLGVSFYESKVKKECELNLPRNQHCVVTAIPVSKEL